VAQQKAGIKYGIRDESMMEGIQENLRITERETKNEKNKERGKSIEVIIHPDGFPADVYRFAGRLRTGQ
jgi:hypothetical protein